MSLGTKLYLACRECQPHFKNVGFLYKNQERIQKERKNMVHYKELKRDPKITLIRVHNENLKRIKKEPEIRFIRKN